MGRDGKEDLTKDYRKVLYLIMKAQQDIHYKSKSVTVSSSEDKKIGNNKEHIQSRHTGCCY